MKEKLIFMDVPNLDRGFEEAFGGELNHCLLWNELYRKWKVKNIYFFDVYIPGDERKRIRLKKYQKTGFKIRKKEMKKLPDKTWKGDVDAMMLVKIPDIVRRYQPEEVEIVIMSGDGDFCELIENLQTKGFVCSVLAFSSTLSNDLIDIADDHETLDEILLKIERREREVAKEETNEIMENLKEKKDEGKEKSLSKVNPFSS